MRPGVAPSIEPKVRAVGLLAATLKVPPANVRYLGITFSPDGNHIYYTTSERGTNLGLLHQIAVLGG